jgi:hypothetical protein
MIISSPAFKDRIRRTQESTFTEECTIEKYAETYDSYNDVIPGYTSISGVKCGVDIKMGKENIKGMTIITQDINFRIPMMDISTQDGITYSGIFYNVNAVARGKGILLVAAQYKGT